MESIFDFFSCKSWLILRERTFHSLINKFLLEKVKDGITWGAALEEIEHGSNSHDVFIVSQAGDYIIVDNLNLEEEGAKLSKEISMGNEIVFNMAIDIWVPYMYTEIYSAQTLIRRVEYELNTEYSRVEISEKGRKTQWEDKIKYTPTSPIGYDDFFYPLYFMDSLGLEIKRMEKMINENVQVYQRSRIVSKLNKGAD